MRWRLGDLGEASALDSRESSAFRTPLVTLEAAGLKQFDGPHFFCNGVSPQEHRGFAVGVCSNYSGQVTRYEQRHGGRGAGVL